MRLGIDTLLESQDLIAQLKNKRVALLGHPASTTSKIHHSLDAIMELGKFKVVSAFGPQHGMRGDKQDNMIESEEFIDSRWKIPVYSLYGKVRRPTASMLDSFDIVLIDLQDVGCRIYTYLTTLFYMLEDCAKTKKAVWVLDRPNPAGRPIEGNNLEKGFESFVGMGPLPMRHGMTLGELAKWIVHKYKLDVDLKVVAMSGYKMNTSPGYGWPEHELSWVNPSPNIPTLCTARVFCGTVLLEGTNLSEGRGTTRPLQIFGAPNFDAEIILKEMNSYEARWMQGSKLRPCFFEPAFHKFKGQLCSGLQFHVDNGIYGHESFKPYRQMLSLFKALRKKQPEIFEWRQPPYEYETERMPIDLLCGTSKMRQWVDDKTSTPQDLESLLAPDESAWRSERSAHLLYD